MAGHWSLAESFSPSWQMYSMSSDHRRRVFPRVALDHVQLIGVRVAKFTAVMVVLNRRASLKN